MRTDTTPKVPSITSDISKSFACLIILCSRAYFLTAFAKPALKPEI